MFKTCNKCLLEKTLDNFQKDSRYKSGYRNQCYSCRDLLNKKRLLNIKNNNKGKNIYLNKNQFKFCPKCLKNKTILRFAKNGLSKDGLQIYCKECSNNSLKGRYHRYKQNSKYRKKKFELTLSEFDEVTKLPCVYCGGYNGLYNDVYFNGIDRIDSNKGYEINNCTPCCSRCNEKKNDLTQEEFKKEIEKIYLYFVLNKKG